MNRRKFLGAIASTGTIAIAGCSDSGEERDSKQGAGGGIHIDYDKSVNMQDGKTYIDTSVQTWFNCGGYFDIPKEAKEGVELTVEVRALGEVVASENWTVTYRDCMSVYSRTFGWKLDEEYDNVLLTITHDTSI